MRSRNTPPEIDGDETRITAPAERVTIEHSTNEPHIRISSAFLEKVQRIMSKDRTSRVSLFLIEDPMLFYREIIQLIQTFELDPVEAALELQDHVGFFDKLVAIDGLFLQLAPEKFRADLKLGQKACFQNYLAYEFATACHDDEVTTLQLIQAGHWEILRWSSPRLRRFVSITHPAIEHSFGTFLYVDPELRDFESGLDPVIEAMKHENDREYFLDLVKKCGLFLQHGSEVIKHDLDVNKAAVSENWRASEFAMTFRENMTCVMALLDVQGLALRYTPTFQSNMKAACRAVDNNLAAIMYVDPSIRAQVIFNIRHFCHNFSGWYSSIHAIHRTESFRRKQTGPAVLPRPKPKLDNHS